MTPSLVGSLFDPSLLDSYSKPGARRTVRVPGSFIGVDTDVIISWEGSPAGYEELVGSLHQLAGSAPLTAPIVIDNMMAVVLAVEIAMLMVDWNLIIRNASVESTLFLLTTSGVHYDDVITLNHQWMSRGDVWYVTNTWGPEVSIMENEND